MDFGDNNVKGSVTGCRRGTERYGLLYSGEAFVEFVGPEARAWKLELLGISPQGVCFGLRDGQPALERGSRIQGTVVRVGAERISGSLLVAHTTEEFAAGTICGAEFHPSSADEEQKLKRAIATLGW